MRSVCFEHVFFYVTGETRLCDLTDLQCLKVHYSNYKLRFPSASGSAKFNFHLPDAPSTFVPDGQSYDASSCGCPPLCNNVDYDVQSSSGDFKAKEFQITPFL
jgi:hypothetical protein